MSTEPLNTIPIQQYIKQVQSAEASRSKDVRLTIEQAKNLAFTLGIVMSRLHGEIEAKQSSTPSNDVIEIKMDPGSNW
jgi:hypothetical protein